MASPEEMSRLPEKSEAEHAEALANWNCPHLADNGCTVYDERPLVCRLFGTTARLLCPHGRHPEMMIDPELEKRIEGFFRQTRRVLV